MAEAASGEARPSAGNVLALTAIAMLAFAANSLLCRLALGQELIDPANFATSGAIVTRTRVTPTIEDDGDSVPASGQPVSIAIAAAGDRAGSLSRALDRAAASRADAYLHP